MHPARLRQPPPGPAPRRQKLAHVFPRRSWPSGAYDGAGRTLRCRMGCGASRVRSGNRTRVMG